MKLMNVLMASAIACACAAAPAAQAATDEKTVLTFEPGSRDIAPARLAGACAVNIMSINDHRLTKDSIGVDTVTPTDAPQAWISKSLDGLTEYGFKVQHSATPVPDALNLNVDLIRAYTWFGNMRINGMVALDVTQPAMPDAPAAKYRAAGSKTNMWGANSEHVTALNYAVNGLLNQMAPSLQKRCMEAKLASN